MSAFGLAHFERTRRRPKSSLYAVIDFSPKVDHLVFAPKARCTR